MSKIDPRFENVSKNEIDQLIHILETSNGDINNLNSFQKDLLNYLNSSLPQLAQLAMQKVNLGQENDLTDLEKFAFERMQESNQNREQLPLSIESQANFERFRNERDNTQGFEINHITDIHNTGETFEQVLLSNLYQSEHLEINENGQIEIGDGNKRKLKDNVAVVVTGDVGTDFFDTQNHGLEAFLTQTIRAKANWSEEEKLEFESKYLELMEIAGLDEGMIRENSPLLQGENSPLQMFHYYLFGIADPNFLTKNELKDFKKKRERVQELLKKAMKNHARAEYSYIKDTFEKYGLTPNQVAIVSGNHDLPYVMQEVLGDYMITPGKTRNVSGVNFGNVLDSANGNFTGGPYFNDIFGYAGLREDLDKKRFDSKPFQKVQSILKSHGIEFDDFQLKRYMDTSVQRAAQGIGSGALGELFKKEIKPVLTDYITQRLSDIEKNIPKNADIILQHTMIDDPQRAGLEEIALHRLLAKKHPNTVVLHGHEHSQTPHRKENIFYLNPGSAASGNSAVHILDKNKRYQSSLYKGMDEHMQDTYRHLRKEEVPGHPSGRYQQAG